jgi:hypothetical protein
MAGARAGDGMTNRCDPRQAFEIAKHVDHRLADRTAADQRDGEARAIHRFASAHS